MTGGEVSDCTQLETSLDIGPDITPRAALTDKGYDSAANRAVCRKRGIIPVIPHRSNAKNRPNFFPKLLYKTRARIEQAIGKLKRFKRVVLRCEKTAESYGAFVAFACTLILVKSVHSGLGGPMFHVKYGTLLPSLLSLPSLRGLGLRRLHEPVSPPGRGVGAKGLAGARRPCRRSTTSNTGVASSCSASEATTTAGMLRS